MRDPDELFAALNQSSFRRRFRLGPQERSFLDKKGLEIILRHGREMLVTRLAPAEPLNDGKQTPMRGHPVFIAQHATGTCCRSCLAKWHFLSAGRELTSDELDYVVGVIRQWLLRQDLSPPVQQPTRPVQTWLPLE